MTCLVHIEFRARKDTVAAMLDWLRAILPDTRCRQGCVSISVTRNQDDPTIFAFVEQWASRQDYENYFKWREETGVIDTLAQWTDGKASFRFFDYVGV